MVSLGARASRPRLILGILLLEARARRTRSQGRHLRAALDSRSELSIIRSGAVTTGPNSGFEILVPGRQDCSPSKIPLSGAPISFVGPLHFFFPAIYGVFGTSTQSVFTFVLSLPVLSTDTTS